MTALRPQGIYAYYDPSLLKSEIIAGGVRIRSMTPEDEFILEYIGKSQLTGNHVFWNANAGRFDLVAEDKVHFLKEVI